MRTMLVVHLRQSLRGLRRNPTFATAALLTLALAIGSNTAVFSVVNGVLLNPLPYPEPDSLVSVVTHTPGAPGVSGGNDQIPASFPLTLNAGETPEQVRAVGVSRGVLDARSGTIRLGSRSSASCRAASAWSRWSPDVLIPEAFDRSKLVLVFFEYQMIGRLKPASR